MFCHWDSLCGHAVTSHSFCRRLLCQESVLNDSFSTGPVAVVSGKARGLHFMGMSWEIGGECLLRVYWAIFPRFPWACQWLKLDLASQFCYERKYFAGNWRSKDLGMGGAWSPIPGKRLPKGRGKAKATL